MFVITQIYEEERSLHRNSNGHVKQIKTFATEKSLCLVGRIEALYAKLRKAPIGFVTSVSPSLRPSA